MLLVLLSALELSAPAAGAVPPGVQAVMFRKIVSYDKALATKKPEEINVAVAYDADKAAAEDVAQAFRAAGFKAAALDLATVPKHIAKTDLLYFSNEKDAAKLAPSVKGSGALSISGDAALAENGVVAVALGLDADGKPRIFVHMGKIEEDKHALSATLLSLVRLIK